MHGFIVQGQRTLLRNLPPHHPECGKTIAIGRGSGKTSTMASRFLRTYTTMSAIGIAGMFDEPVLSVGIYLELKE